MDIRLFYEEKGRGIPFVMLHGNGEDHTFFKRQIDFFSKEYRVIAIDSRGHGKSPRGEKPFSLVTMADDLYDFFILKKIKKVILLGFSDGGNIALIFAIKHPEMVKKLILNGANLNPAGVKRSFQKSIEDEYKKAVTENNISTEATRKIEMLGLMVNEPNIDEENVKKLNIRTLVIAGTRDMISKKHTDKIADLLPRSSLVYIKGDHFIADKRFADFNNAVKEFLDDNL